MKKPKIPKEVQEFCKKYPLCKGCPFGTCITPVNDRDYPEWVDQTNRKILKYIEEHTDEK
jgi:hypothetical protein